MPGLHPCDRQERNSMFDFDHPFFKPLPTRIIITAILFGWTAFELYGGSQLWALLFGGLGVISAYNFFIAPRRPPDE